MDLKIIQEQGYYEALFGLGLSYGITSELNMAQFLNSGRYRDKLKEVASKLCKKDGGHNKFLESIQIWVDVIAPRYFWQEADTYRVGSTKQSESTIHTIIKKELSEVNFEGRIDKDILNILNTEIKNKNFEFVKHHLPESFLQRRIWNLNYKTLRNIINQRTGHKLKEWNIFITSIKEQVNHPEFLF